MKNLDQRIGFVNRHTDGLPKSKCAIKVVIKDPDVEPVLLCEWKPFDKSEHTINSMPKEGYLGVAKVIEG